MPAEKFSIHIDKDQVFATSSPLTGSQIRALVTPPVPTDRDLFLKVPGPGDDRRIGDNDPVEIHNGLQFYTAPSQINPGGAA